MPSLLTRSLTGAVLMLSPAALAGEAPPPIRALLVSGANNHDWQYTTPSFERTLEATGRFVVDVTEQAATTLADAEGLKAYQVIVLNYNGPRWGDAAERAFVDAVRAGTGVVVIHAANNAFEGWADYERMVGLLWRSGTGHGSFHAFDVTYDDREHPITRGLADMRAHPDELYHRLVNTQNAVFKVLASAMSTTESGGSGQREPMAIVLEFGKGRVFHTPLGHVWPGSPEQRASVEDPQFKILLARGTEWAATGAVTLSAAWSFGAKEESRQPVHGEQGGEWTVLFDGTSTDAWRGFKSDAFPAQGWVIEDGALKHVAGAGGGDIITREQFQDFELRLEWKAAPGANSGIFYRVQEVGNWVWETGPEMQVLDDALHADGKNPKTSAGSLYGLIACAKPSVKPAGEWNAVRIVVMGPHVEHWLNGTKVVEYELGSEAWNRMIAESKFKDMPNFGRMPAGHIALQDHGDDVWFRNIKIRRLK